MQQTRDELLPAHGAYRVGRHTAVAEAETRTRARARPPRALLDRRLWRHRVELAPLLRRHAVGRATGGQARTTRAAAWRIVACCRRRRSGRLGRHSRGSGSLRGGRSSCRLGLRRLRLRCHRLCFCRADGSLAGGSSRLASPITIGRHRRGEACRLLCPRGRRLRLIAHRLRSDGSRRGDGSGCVGLIQSPRCIIGSVVGSLSLRFAERLGVFCESALSLGPLGCAARIQLSE